MFLILLNDLDNKLVLGPVVSEKIILEAFIFVAWQVDFLNKLKLFAQYRCKSLMQGTYLPNFVNFAETC